MPNIRPLNEKKYNISPHRFKELYHFCLQYKEWKQELSDLGSNISISKLEGIASSGGVSDITGDTVSRMESLRKKCELIEQTAIEADSEIYQYIIDAVTNEGVSYAYLYTRRGIPCGKDLYYDRRRKFYWLLSQKV